MSGTEYTFPQVVENNDSRSNHLSDERPSHAALPRCGYSIATTSRRTDLRL